MGLAMNLFATAVGQREAERTLLAPVQFFYLMLTNVQHMLKTHNSGYQIENDS